MLTIELVKAAAQAEKIRLKALSRREARRAVMALVAAVFAVMAVVSLHGVAFILLDPQIGPLYAVLVLLGADIVIAIVFGVIAASSRPSKIEREAVLIRRQALGQAKQRLLSDLAMPVLGVVMPWPRSLFLLQFLLRALWPRRFRRRESVRLAERRVHRAA